MFRNRTEFARGLRKNETDAERLLWSKLRAKQMFGLKFRRQQPIGPFVADFICFEIRLVIELDGGQHATDVIHDEQRDRWFAENGFHILRFWNNDIFGNLDGVLARIESAAAPSPNPSPPGRGMTDT